VRGGDTPLGHPRLVKLVRDRIGELLPDSRVSYEPITDPVKAIEAARSKLVEEALEYLLSPCIGELADVYETMRVLLERDLGMTWQQLEAAAAEKRAERGGYEGLTGMYVRSTANPKHEGEHAVCDSPSDHEFGEWEDDAVGVTRECRYCGHRENRPQG
jgi:predicted house-cleaning noncanonical NTP pyrophosphatase (MazG superfamily)